MSGKEEKGEKKATSKIGALLSNTKEINNSQIYVYYSQNNWKTSEIVELIVDEKTTVLQLIDIVIFKLKTEFFYDDIEEKNYDLLFLKKKTNQPNYNYPKCNPEALVLDYHKSHFCLVEQEKIEEKEVINEQNNNDKNDVHKEKGNNKKEKELKINEEKEGDKNVKKPKENKKIEKECKKGCFLF